MGAAHMQHAVVLATHVQTEMHSCRPLAISHATSWLQSMSFPQLAPTCRMAAALLKWGKVVGKRYTAATLLHARDKQCVCIQVQLGPAAACLLPNL